MTRIEELNRLIAAGKVRRSWPATYKRKRTCAAGVRTLSLEPRREIPTEAEIRAGREHEAREIAAAERECARRHATGGNA